MRPIVKIVIVYFVLGCLWIFLSDYLLVEVFNLDSSKINLFQTIKGTGYVIFTTGLLYIILLRYERKRRNYIEKLKNHNAEVKLLFESDEITLLRLSPRGKVKNVSNKFLKLTGYNRKEVIGESYRYFLHPDQSDKIAVILRSLSKRNIESFNTEIEVPTKSGEILWFNFIGAGVYLDGKLVNVITLAHDITRKRKEDTERSRIIMEGQEKERKRISMILHDSLAQIFAGLKMQIQSVRGDVEEDMREATFDRIIELVQDGIKQVRDLSHELKPPEFERGLLITLRQFFNNKKNLYPGINFNIIISENIDEDDLKIFDKLNLFRIIQEFTTNCIKHSECNNFSLKMHKSNNYIEVVMEDDGKGFKPSGTHGKGIGLVNMRNRSEIDNIKCDFSTSPGEGTQIRLVKYFVH